MVSKPNPRNANGARRRALRARVIARDDTCWLCKRPVDKSLPAGLPGSPEVHELTPIAQGGNPYDASGCVLCHRACNSWIGNRTPEQLAQGRRAGRARPVLPQPVTTSRRW